MPSVGAVPDQLDLQAMETELRAEVEGEVRFDPGSRALYATDASNYQQTPLSVVIPRTVDSVIAAVETCRKYGAPLLDRGGGTSLAGQSCNVAVVIDFSKYLNRVLHVDPERRIAQVQPGVVLDDLRDAAEEHGLTFGPDPATHNRCTLGGMIGNNSCGVHSVMSGKTDANVETLRVLTYDGCQMSVGRTDDAALAGILAGGGARADIYRSLMRLTERYEQVIRQRFPPIPRRVSGYNLEQLLPENGFNVARALVGTEGTCVTVLEAGVRLVDSPPGRALLVLGYPDVYSAADQVPDILPHRPIALEGFDSRLVQAMRKKGLDTANVALLPDGGGWLLAELGAPTVEQAGQAARELLRSLERAHSGVRARLFTDPRETKMVWEVRESGLGATAIVPGEPPAWPGWEDSAVPPEKLGAYLRDLRALLDRYDYGCSFYGHFGQGCLHTRIDFDLVTAAGIAAFRSFMYEAADLVVRYGGSLSGEHGDGQARAELLARMFGDELMRAFGEFKGIWDPQDRMNPGKVVRPYPLDANLRLGTRYDPPALATKFFFPQDGGSFSHAALRCVGVGKCRRHEAGTMCPSYMVTREEMHSTRGRARLLFEMLQGETVKDGWRSEAVREALDLCLACKGCKGECPVNVDMATYKAEFMSHYYAGRMRPISAYALGLVPIWARLGSKMPHFANWLTNGRVSGRLARQAAGIALQRAVPSLCSETFVDWFRMRGAHNTGKDPVLLWPDTFVNYFHPHIGAAATEVLEAAGFQVCLPRPGLCCGRPLYDYGLLDPAKRWLRRILYALRPQIRAGVPLVGLEPSCLAVFRDELCNLLPHDEDARRLQAQSFLLSEFLEREAPHFLTPRLAGKALVQGHCHHKAIMGMSDEMTVLHKLGLQAELMDSGCCGMAGGFGFERDHYAISVACAERVLLPTVRSAGDDTLIVADGFSCREQIAQLSGRTALHLAEVLTLAMSSSSSRKESKVV